MNKKRILLVDDEVGFTRLFKLNLEQNANYEVRVENWATKALEAAREFRPDLVLLDIIMPHMIGHELAAHLRGDASLKRTPIVFLSAVGGRKSTESPTRRFGEYPYIRKPATLEELINGIERHLPETAGAQGAEFQDGCQSQ